MRRTFLIWLSAVICATFIITGTLVYSQFSRSSLERAEQMMATRLTDMLELFEHSESSISYLSRANDASTQDRARALAEIIHLNPALLHNQEELQGICNRLGAEQVVISREDGIVEAAVPASLVGSMLAAGDNMRLLDTTTSDDAKKELSRKNPDQKRPFVYGKNDQQSDMKFAGVQRFNNAGMVRLGFRTRFEQASREESSIDNPAMRLRMGQDGQVIVFRRGIRVSPGGLPISQTKLLALPTQELCKLKVDNDIFYAYAADGGGYRLIGLLPADEIYGSSLKAVLIVLLSNLLLFVILFIAVSYLLQRIVLRGMGKVNETLRDITEGNLERRVDVTDNPEFTRLSNGINFMVESLRSVGEERQQGLKRGLELARTLQNTVLPGKFPAFPDIHRFDLYATCFQAHEVGGDFYDFSMPDETHLHFLVADVDATGIPAALYMMRAMTILRSIARFGGTPVNIVTEANRELCNDNQTGIRMALFYGCLDISTGKLTYVNAGKLYSLIRHDSDEYTPMPSHTDPVLGEAPTAVFHTLELQLEPQDRLFLSTEGVLHVSNTNNMPFNEHRLQNVLKTDAETVAEVLGQVRTSLRKFVDGSKIKRDITMLCLEYKGDLGDKNILKFTAESTQETLDLITRQLEEVFASPLDITDIQNSVSAVCSALPPEANLRIESSCSEQEAEICLVYDAPAFNPLETLSEALPVDRVTHEFTEQNTIIIWKALT